MRGRDGPWCPRPVVSPAPSPVWPVPARSPRQPRLSLQRGDARGQEAFTKIASLHPSIPASLLLPIPPSFAVSILSTLHPSILLSHWGGGGFIIPQREKSSFLLKIKFLKNPQSGLNSQSTPQPYLHVDLVGAATQHSQAETTSSSLVRSSRVYLSQSLILLTLLLFGPNPISSVHYKDSETTHFCCPAGGWLGAPVAGLCHSRRSGMRSAGSSSSLQRKSLKGNFARDKKHPTFNFLTTAFLPELFILATARSINGIFTQLTSVPAHTILSGVFFSCVVFSSLILFNFSP